MFNKDFIQKCLDGEATLFELDDYIDYWHDNETGVSLQEFLGLTDAEYDAWIKNSDSIFRDFLRCRRDGYSLNEYQSMEEKERIAARSYDLDSIDKLQNNDN